MTIVIALKVGDGIVLGADSASTIVNPGGSYVNSYFNAEKLFNLRKGLPVGALTFGLGGLAGRSVSSLAKDLRERLSDAAKADWYLDKTTFTIEEVAQKLRRFFFDELYTTHVPPDASGMEMGFFVAGYSANAAMGEVWNVRISGPNQCPPPECLISASEPWGAIWEGQTEACTRLVRGFSLIVVQRLKQAGMPEKDAVRLLDAAQPIVHPTMPIQDAVDLVHYLIDVTCGFVRFLPGEATVAQPIDSAAITKHEGYRWVRRKHYYKQEFNVVPS